MAGTPRRSVAGRRLCAVEPPRCAPSTPAQLHRDLRGFYTGDRAWPARIKQEPFREQATKSSPAGAGAGEMK